MEGPGAGSQGKCSLFPRSTQELTRQATATCQGTFDFLPSGSQSGETWERGSPYVERALLAAPLPPSLSPILRLVFFPSSPPLLSLSYPLEAQGFRLSVCGGGVGGDGGIWVILGFRDFSTTQRRIQTQARSEEL